MKSNVQKNTSLDKETLERIRVDLEERRSKIEQELAEFAHKDPKIADNYRTDFPEFGNKEDENAEEIAAYGDRLSIEYSLENTLRDIKKALKAIDEGSYGLCKYCGKPISAKRLLARPVSTSCIECKEHLQNT